MDARRREFVSALPVGKQIIWSSVEIKEAKETSEKEKTRIRKNKSVQAGMGFLPECKTRTYVAHSWAAGVYDLS